MTSALDTRTSVLAFLRTFKSINLRALLPPTGNSPIKLPPLASPHDMSCNRKSCAKLIDVTRDHFFGICVEFVLHHTTISLMEVITRYQGLCQGWNRRILYFWPHRSLWKTHQKIRLKMVGRNANILVVVLPLPDPARPYSKQKYKPLHKLVDWSDSSVDDMQLYSLSSDWDYARRRTQARDSLSWPSVSPRFFFGYQRMGLYIVSTS